MSPGRRGARARSSRGRPTGTPADDLRDREHAGDLAAVDAAGEQADEVVAARAGVELLELVGALRRVGPGAVQPAALAREREELRAVRARQHPQPHPRAARRRRDVHLGGAQRGARRAAAQDGRRIASQ